ncbi:MAG: hypothetical protein QXI19_15110 [Candidatus Caldarchaeum sp.]
MLKPQVPLVLAPKENLKIYRKYDRGRPREPMPQVIGFLCALCALTAGILAQVDPWVALFRAIIAFFIGSILTQIWYVFFAARVTAVRTREPDEGKNDERKTA